MHRFTTKISYFDIGFVCLFERERVMDNKKMNSRRDVESGRTKNNYSYVYDAENHRESCSWLVPAFVFVNVVVFIVAMGINNCPNNSFGLRIHMCNFVIFVTSVS